jgi:DNA-binding NtrC family response regulator
MNNSNDNHLHALLFGLNEELAGELLQPLTNFCQIHSEDECLNAVAASPAQIIFCGADIQTVTKLRETKPHAPIVVVSRHPEVADWLDSIEAGATDYCAAPFETAQMKWILETSMRNAPVQATA